MKIFNYGLSIESGKYKYKDAYLDILAKKFSPQTLTPYSVEFLNADAERCDAVVFQAEKKLDLIVGDLEKIEARLLRAETLLEKETLKQAQKLLESESLLCDADFSQEAATFLKPLQLLTHKPSIGFEVLGSIEELIKAVLAKAKIIIFFTVVKKELRAWGLEQGLSVLEAAGKIHSDLKRGFIKAEIIHAKDVNNFFNIAEARARGLIEVVDKDYVVQPNDIIEIKFNV